MNMESLFTECVRPVVRVLGHAFARPVLIGIGPAKRMAGQGVQPPTGSRRCKRWIEEAERSGRDVGSHVKTSSGCLVYDVDRSPESSLVAHVERTLAHLDLL